MGRSNYGSEAESRKGQRYASWERDDRQARQTLAIRQHPAAAHKPNNKKLVEYQGSHGKIQRYSYADEQESQEKRLYARNGKEEYQAYGYQRHAKEQYRGYSSHVRAGRRSSPPPMLRYSPLPKLQMVKNQNPMLKKKAVVHKNDDSTSSDEDEDESSLEEEEDGTSCSSSSSGDDDEAKYEVFKRMSRMEVTSTKTMKTKMMKW